MVRPFLLILCTAIYRNNIHKNRLNQFPVFLSERSTTIICNKEAILWSDQLLDIQTHILSAHQLFAKKKQNLIFKSAK